MNSKIFQGKVEHIRLKPVRHAFATPVGFMAIDLKELPLLDQELKGFGFNRFAPVSIHEKDYLSSGTQSFDEKLAPWIATLELTENTDSITLVTNPKWFGKSFNPVSFYLLRDRQENLVGMIAEVNNTFGDRHIYPLRLETASGIHMAENNKQFHVSPFNDLEGNYQFSVRSEGDALYIGVNLYKKNEKFLITWMEGTGLPLSTKNLRRHYLRHPFQPWLTLPRIVWQAILLKYRKKLTVFKRPEPSHPHSILNRGSS
ncbi:DUF1365 domain-containing protein [Kiritimatiellota bacterium B12222]|nr:DUF1365 domain-containing protein [Kiritimatiellota bacterium B12222]